jgi:hypothetical protein
MRTTTALRRARIGIVAVTVAAGVVLAGAQAGQADTGVPFKDPSAVGVIAFCNQAGQPITHGSLDTTPFVWRAVSSQAAQPPYNGAGRSAMLYAYQPRQGVDPGQWSGEELTAAATYTNTAHPMAAATDRDEPLKYFVKDYPPTWNGLVEVRMYLAATNQPADSLSYPTAVLKISGNTWQVVSGGTADCSSGKAISIESILLPKQKSKTHGSKHPASSRPTAQASTGAGSSASPGGAGSSTGPSSAAGGSASPVADSTSAGSGGNTSTLLGLLVAAVVLLATIGYFVSRRRRAATSPPSSGSSAPDSSEKGR